MKLWLLFLLTLGLPTQATELPKKILIASDIWCPFICEINSDTPGYLIEITTTVFAKLGIEVEYHSLGYNKSKDLAEKGQIQAFLAAGVTNHGNTLLSQELLGIDRTVLVMRKNQIFDQTQLFASLDKLFVGVIKDYTYDQHGPLDEYLAQRKLSKHNLVILNHMNAVEALFRLLRLKSIDVFPENPVVANYMLNKLKIKNHLKLIDVPRHDHIYVAFSPDNIGEKLRELYDQEVRKLKKSGEFQVLLARYNVQDEVSQHQD